MPLSLVIVRGIPGSGKSTFAKKKFPDHILFEADMYFERDGKYNFDPALLAEAHHYCFWAARSALYLNRNVIVANTFARVSMFTDYITLAEQIEARVQVFKAIGQFPNIHGCPDTTIRKMTDQWEYFPGEFVVPIEEGGENSGI